MNLSTVFSLQETRANVVFAKKIASFLKSLHQIIRNYPLEKCEDFSIMKDKVKLAFYSLEPIY